MKFWGINKKYLALALLSSVGCSKGDQPIDKRQTKLAAVLEQSDATAEQKPQDNNPKSGDAKPVELVSIDFGSLQASAVSGFEQVPAEELAQPELIVKLSDSEFLLAVKDGRSWYKAADGSVKELEAVVIAPEGAKLYSLPEGQFWFVSPEALGRRKAGAAAGAAGAPISVEQFSTKSLKGDVKKIKTLYASANEIILHLDTHIAILSIKDGKSLLNQFEIAGLPVDLKGSVQAGKMANDGYWFLSNAGLSLLLPGSGKDLVWSKGQLVLPEGAQQVAMILDSDTKKDLGESYILSASGLLSSAAKE